VPQVYTRLQHTRLQGFKPPRSSILMTMVTMTLWEVLSCQQLLTMFHRRVDGALIPSHIPYRTTTRRVRPPAADSTRLNLNTPTSHNHRLVCYAKNLPSSAPNDPIVETEGNPVTRTQLYMASHLCPRSNYPLLALQIMYLYPSLNSPNLFPRNRIFTDTPRSHFR
jgi:hypothetical protein